MRETMACSLGRRDFNHRRQAWVELLAGRLLRRESTEDGCVLTLTAARGVAAAARRLAREEAECCPWMKVQVDEGEVLTLRLSSSSGGGAEAIRELFQAG